MESAVSLTIRILLNAGSLVMVFSVIIDQHSIFSAELWLLFGFLHYPYFLFSVISFIMKKYRFMF